VARNAEQGAFAPPAHVRRGKMKNAGSLPDSGESSPDSPPNVVVLRASKQAKALARCVYVYRSRSTWVVTTNVWEPPSDAAVWLIPANRNDPERHNLGGT